MPVRIAVDFPEELGLGSVVLFGDGIKTRVTGVFRIGGKLKSPKFLKLYRRNSAGLTTELTSVGPRSDSLMRTMIGKDPEWRQVRYVVLRRLPLMEKDIAIHTEEDLGDLDCFGKIQNMELLDCQICTLNLSCREVMKKK